MKKHTIFISLFMVAVILFSVGVSAFVAKKTYPSIEDVLREQSSEDRELLLDSSLYVDETRSELQMKQEYVDDEPLIKFYGLNGSWATVMEEWGKDSSFEYYEESMKESPNLLRYYLTFTEDKVRAISVSETEEGKTEITLTDFQKPTGLLSYITQGSAVQSFCGKQCQILDVIVVFSTCIYFLTDQGTFVRYYDYYRKAFAAEFSLADFQEYCKIACVERQESIEKQREGREGELLVGLGASHLASVVTTQARDALVEIDSFERYRPARIELTAAMSAMLILTGGIIAVVIHNKHKKAISPQEEQPPTEL